jgi:polysaccharide biosynthesis transport protein
LDLRELLSVVWKRRYLVLLVVFLCAVFGVTFAITRQERYESTATIAITPDVETQGFIPSENLSTLLGTYSEAAESEAVLEEAEATSGRPLPADITADTEEGTGVLRISAEADSASVARDAAQAVTNAFLQRVGEDEFVSTDLVDPASTPDEAVQPRPPLIVITSIGVGLGVAVLLALALDRLRRRIETPADLAELTALPLISQIPRNRTLARSEGPRLVWDDRDLRDLQESFRSLRTNLMFVAAESKVAVQFTSAGVGEGKSTTVANLGMAFAQIGVKTAIIDADLRRPAQERIFHVDSRPWVEGPTRRDPAKAWRTSFPNLFVLPAGPSLDDPAEVLHINFARLLESLRGSFELILVDTPPVLPVADARITAARVDGVVLVVAAGQDRPASLEGSLKELEFAGADVKGVVLNQAAGVGVGYDYYQPPAALPEQDERRAAAIRPVRAARDKS